MVETETKSGMAPPPSGPAVATSGEFGDDLADAIAALTPGEAAELLEYLKGKVTR